MTETYVAYGVTEGLVKECAKQADYFIPQAKQRGAEIPKTTDGQDLGIGTGWWYEGTLLNSIYLAVAAGSRGKFRLANYMYPQNWA